ncbi:MAG: orotidine-5'-phosphate decarboxylase [Ignavibacteriales bacterium]|nr:orotidine-5'-phosphate decarboxylase [Ignavibacteriales bacterium]
MTFAQRLHTVQKKSNSLLCIGLDTDMKKIPKHLQSKKNGVLEFNKQIIESTKDLACAYKINFAFYEVMGKDGWTIIEKTRALIPSSILTIADAKRGDIGNSSGYYANAILHELNFDSITVAPYMGKDSVQPFLQDEKKGVFLLALTSNEGAFDFQYQQIGHRKLFEEVVAISQQWTTNENLGFVVGATKSTDIQSVRKLAPAAPFLVPGIGAQGGSIEDVVKYGCTSDGFGVLINASRSILYASNGKDFADAARNEAMKLRDEINFFRKRLIR